MKQLIIAILVFLALTSSVFAYYPGETTYIDALYTENNGATDANANISIYSPTNILLINNQAMTEYETGKFYYTYTFPENVTGSYKAEVSFYNDSWSLLGVAQEDYEVQYNYTETLNDITNVTFETKSLVENIWDFIQTKLLGNYVYSTEVIGKAQLYNEILFKTTANYDLTDCEILINENTYNMSLIGKYAYYEYYIENDGLYQWEVSCE